MKLIFLVATLVLLSSQLQFAHADGTLTGTVSGEYGVNRRVLTTSNSFTGVRGRFKVPTTYVYPFSPYSSKPTFYLGASRAEDAISTLEVDAGLQWEPRLPITQGGINTFIPAGWSIFIRSTTPANGPKGYQVNPVGAWRCGYGTDNGATSYIDLSWIFYRRQTPTSGLERFGGYLLVNAIDASEQPKGEFGNNKIIAKADNTASGYGLTDVLDGMICKRVVGVTQNTIGELPRPNGGVYDEDGTQVTGLIFSSGEVTQASPLIGPFGPNYNAGGWTKWMDTNTNLNTAKLPGDTGFFPGGKDLTLRLVRVTGLPRGDEEIILSGNATGAKDVFKFNAEADREAPRPARYADEDIDINLRRVITTGGPILAPGN